MAGLGDFRLATVGYRLLTDGGGCCKTSFSIGDQAAAG
jgi:hypothetical protein